MIFCTKCGTQHQNDDNFCKKCGNPLPKDIGSGKEQEGDKKLIRIRSGLAKSCLQENLTYHRVHQQWREKTFGWAAAGPAQQQHEVWIQYDPLTGRNERLLVTFPLALSSSEEIANAFKDPDLSQLRPGWRYLRLFVPLQEWEIDAYLNSPPENQIELNTEEYQFRFV